MQIHSAKSREIPSPTENPGTPQSNDSRLPSNWREAILSLIASRFALIQLESKDAAADGLKRLTSVIAAVICIFFTWALLLAGGIAAIAHATGTPWYWISVAAASAHLLIAIILVNSAKTQGSPHFPITLSEFQKDREWLENFQKTRKSNV